MFLQNISNISNSSESSKRRILSRLLHMNVCPSSAGDLNKLQVTCSMRELSVASAQPPSLFHLMISDITVGDIVTEEEDSW